MKLIRLTLSILCAFFGLRLLFSTPELLDLYRSWGFSAVQMQFAGLLQIVAGLGIWFAGFEKPALLMIWTVVSVALATHWRLDHSGGLYIPGLVVGGLSLLLLLRRQEEREEEKEEQKEISPNLVTKAPSSLNVCPESFTDQPFEVSFLVNSTPSHVAKVLNATSTFSDGQIFPFRVEFLDPSTGRFTKKFEEGILTNHHGPLLSAVGILREIDFPNYRDLQYFYGAYAISFRLFRPHRLEIFTTEENSKCRVRVRLSTYVKNGWGWLWRLGQTCFWPSFVVGVKLRFILKSSNETTE